MLIKAREARARMDIHLALCWYASHEADKHQGIIHSV